MSSVFTISLIEKLNAQHEVKKFRCGQHALDFFLERYALKNQLAETSQTYVVHRNQVVIGYMTLVFGAVSLDEAPVAITSTVPKVFPIPVMILAHWAVDKKEQGRGIGRGLLKEAFLKTLAAADIAGLRAILVDAISPEMETFYKNLGFMECPVGERRLMMPIETVRLTIEPEQA
jgi:hypothetical protein